MISPAEEKSQYNNCMLHIKLGNLCTLITACSTQKVATGVLDNTIYHLQLRCRHIYEQTLYSQSSSSPQYSWLWLRSVFNSNNFVDPPHRQHGEDDVIGAVPTPAKFSSYNECALCTAGYCTNREQTKLRGFLPTVHAKHCSVQARETENKQYLFRILARICP